MIYRWVILHPPRYPFAGAYMEFSLITGIGQGWKDVQVLDLETCSRPALRGIRPGTVSILRVVNSLAWAEILYPFARTQAHMPFPVGYRKI